MSSFVCFRKSGHFWLGVSSDKSRLVNDAPTELVSITRFVFPDSFAPTTPRSVLQSITEISDALWNTKGTYSPSAHGRRKYKLFTLLYESSLYIPFATTACISLSSLYHEVLAPKRPPINVFSFAQPFFPSLSFLCYNCEQL